MWVGPRNELRGTKVETSVVLCDGALDALSNVEESKIWDAFAKARKHFNPTNPHQTGPMRTNAWPWMLA